RGEERGGQPCRAGRDRRFPARLRGGGLRPAGALPHGLRPGAARSPGRGPGGPVRYGVVGGGPAGLYFALLARKADPQAEVRVVERNAPDATFGWGVVFSEETLGALRDADFESYTQIQDSFARWSAIDIHYAGALVRSRGHVFTGISRRVLP